MPSASLSSAIHTLRFVKDAIRHPYTDLGSYPVVIYAHDGEAFCIPCARENYRAIAHSTIWGDSDGWRVAGADIHWEHANPACPDTCVQCGAPLPTAY